MNGDNSMHLSFTLVERLLPDLQQRIGHDPRSSHKKGIFKNPEFEPVLDGLDELMKVFVFPYAPLESWVEDNKTELVIAADSTAVFQGAAEVKKKSTHQRERWNQGQLDYFPEHSVDQASTYIEGGCGISNIKQNLEWHLNKHKDPFVLGDPYTIEEQLAAD